MPDPIALDRARGSLLGMAVGDALGAPLEGLSAQQIRSHYRQVVDYVDGVRAWKRKPYRWRMPGLYSDDTQQALVLAECLRTCGAVDPEWVGRVYQEMANPRMGYLGAHRGVGRSFRQVMTDLEGGASPRDTGTASAGIGAAMRIAPVGLYYAAHDGDLVPAVLDASLITHRDIRSLAGAVAVAAAVRRLASGEVREPAWLFLLAAEVARAEDRIATESPRAVVAVGAYRHAMSRSIAFTEGVLDKPRDRALALIVDEANRHGAEPICRRATQGFPPALIPTCLYFLFTTDSFEEAIVEAVNLGGDADTTGAILGAMAGAYYGVQAIPDRWLEGLRNRNGLALRAEALGGHGIDEAELPDLVATEWQLTESENLCRSGLMPPPQQPGGDLGANRRL